MRIKNLSDKKIIETHFRKNTGFNIYSIGDLDDFFWKFTDWYALYNRNILKQIALLYSGSDTPTLIAITDKEDVSMYELIEKIKSRLPSEFYAH